MTSFTPTSNMTTNYTNISDAAVQRKPPSAEDLAFYALVGRVSRGVTLFTLIWCPTLIILGSLFNCLSFAVLTRPNMRKVSANIYLATLAVADIWLVWTTSLPRLFEYLDTGVDLRCIARCKLYPFFGYWSGYMSRWLVVMVAIDRFIAVYFPLKKAFICTTKKAYLICFVLLCLTFPIGLQWAIIFNGRSYIGKTIFEGNVYDFISPQAKFYYYFIWHKIGPFTGLLIPGSIIFAMNALIVLRLNKMKQSNELSESTTQNRSAAIRSTHMLIAISITYMILLTPYSVVAVLMEFGYADKTLTRQEAVQMYVAHQVAMFMNALNSVANFPLYCVSDRVFREHLASLLRCPGYKDGKKKALSTSALTLSSALSPGSTSTADNAEKTRM